MDLQSLQTGAPPGQFSEPERSGVYRAIRQRRDIREFRDDPIDETTLARLIQAAHHGPSVGFMQPWDFIVVRDMERRRQVKALLKGNGRPLPASMTSRGDPPIWPSSWKVSSSPRPTCASPATRPVPR